MAKFPSRVAVVPSFWLGVSCTTKSGTHGASQILAWRTKFCTKNFGAHGQQERLARASIVAAPLHMHVGRMYWNTTPRSADFPSKHNVLRIEGFSPYTSQKPDANIQRKLMEDQPTSFFLQHAQHNNHVADPTHLARDLEAFYRDTNARQSILNRFREYFNALIVWFNTATVANKKRAHGSMSANRASCGITPTGEVTRSQASQHKMQMPCFSSLYATIQVRVSVFGGWSPCNIHMSQLDTKDRHAHSLALTIS